jgi:transposase
VQNILEAGMAGSVQQLTVAELEERVRAAKGVVERSHCQAIWLLAKGHSTAEVAEIVALSPRWINKLARRYEGEGADALGDRRRGNRGASPLLDEADLEALRERLKTPPEDGGLWSGPKVARWIAARRGLVHVHAPRGWEALQKLNWSLQVPRPKNPGVAPPEEQAAFKKSLPTPSRRRAATTPASRSSSGRPTSTGSA